MEIPLSLRRRLLPLYGASFFQGLVFWYAIEKLFMRSIGFSDAMIGVMIAIYSAVMLIAQTPSGIIADRWSRKGMLMVSCVVLVACSIVGALSNSVGMYLVSAALWGVFFGIYSGAYDAIVYDVLSEEHQPATLFDATYGRVRVADSIGLMIGSVAGGAIAGAWGLRAPYWLTIPAALVSILLLVRFREPTLHKQHEPIPILVQIRQTLAAVATKRPLIPVLAILVLADAVEYLMLEFSQLWYLALHTPAVWYGPANAVLLASFAVGGTVAGYTRRHKMIAYGMFIAMTLGGIGLVTIHSMAGILVMQFIVAAGAIVVGINYLRILHDNLGSAIRSGASSAAGSMGRILIIPLALIFGSVSSRLGVYHAGWILLVTVAAISVIAVAHSRRRAGEAEAVQAAS